MSRNLLNIIKKEIESWNRIEENFPDKNHELFKLVDFDYLEKYSQQQIGDFEITSFIDFCTMCALNEIAEKAPRQSIWFWEGVNELV